VGGGRYDDLIEQLGGKPTPAVGFASGIERIILTLKGRKINPPGMLKPIAFIAYLGKEAKTEAAKLASQLRDAEIAVIIATGDKSLKSQLRQANSLGTNYTIIIGEREVKIHSVVLRDMITNKQETLSVTEIAKALER
ncbi:MAG: ATP phosphoribosyltransferase regulatory subunit, partial [Dehalococcoidia bacterium]|nr:ATP phosphoribosyltransferase regulatory subunit [Dehalococcoidia bacterium]